VVDATRLVQSLPAGTNTIGGVVLKASATAPGTTTQKVISVATTPTPALLKASLALLKQWELTNVAAYPVYVKFYNKATVGLLASDVPFLVIAVPAGGVVRMPSGEGVAFSLGLSWVVTKLIADTDATAVAAGDIVGHFTWI
jgi:hypothetical protein